MNKERRRKLLEIANQKSLACNDYWYGGITLRTLIDKLDRLNELAKEED